MGGAASNGGGVAIIVGAVLGAMVGGSIRRATDKTDHPCLGHALVLARKNHRVVWTGANAVAYAVAPRKENKNNGRQCREYVTELGSGRHWEKSGQKRAAILTAPGA